MSNITSETIEKIITQVVKESNISSNCGDECVPFSYNHVDELMEFGANRIGAVVKSCPTKEELAHWVDHTLLKPDAVKDEIIKVCQEAKEYKFASVCINPTWISLAQKQLRGTAVKVCSVIGFPLGATLPEIKAAEARAAIAAGADEVDMVINIGALKSSDYSLVERDIRGVVRAAGRRTVKVILETCFLSDEEKEKACLIAKDAGAHFVKTSTGFGKSGATVKDVALMRKTVGAAMGVKASGGVRTYEDACKMVEAGATRIGASASVEIVSNSKKSGIKNSY
jgi:deoxyribose-phosphate aldolase